MMINRLKAVLVAGVLCLCMAGLARADALERTGGAWVLDVEESLSLQQGLSEKEATEARAYLSKALVSVSIDAKENILSLTSEGKTISTAFSVSSVAAAKVKIKKTSGGEAWFELLSKNGKELLIMGNSGRQMAFVRAAEPAHKDGAQ